MLPTNRANMTGIIDFDGGLLVTDELRFSELLGNVYRFEHRKNVDASGNLTIVFDPSINGMVEGRHYEAAIAVSTTVRPILIEFWEGGAFSSLGTEITIYNFNRNSGCDSSLNPYAKLYHTPTVDSSGNKYAPDAYIFASSSVLGTLRVTAPGQSPQIPAMLDPTKKYCVKFTNLGDAQTTVTVMGIVKYMPDYRAGGR